MPIDDSEPDELDEEISNSGRKPESIWSLHFDNDHRDELTICKHPGSTTPILAEYDLREHTSISTDSDLQEESPDAVPQPEAYTHCIGAGWLASR